MGKVFNSKKNGIHQVMAHAGEWGSLVFTNGHIEAVIGKRGIKQNTGRIKKCVLALLQSCTTQNLIQLKDRYDTTVFVLPVSLVKQQRVVVVNATTKRKAAA